MEYKEVLHALSQAKVRYLVCGGLAATIFGVPRMTADIDILLDFEIKNLTSFENVVASQKYTPLIPVQLSKLADKAARLDLVSNKNLIAYNYFHSQAGKMSLDVLLDVPISFDKMWENRVEIGIFPNSFFTVSLQDLVTLKKYSNRLQDQKDILLLTKIKNG